MNEVIDIMVAQLASSIDEIDVSEITEENYDTALEVVKNTLMTNPEWQNLDKNFANVFIDNDLSEEDGKALVQDMLNNLDASFDTLNYEGFKKNVLDFCREQLKEKLTLFHETYGRTVIEFELINVNAKIPSYAHPTDTGADVYAVEDIVIPAATCGAMVPLGFKMKIPAGWGIQVRPRSGMSAKTTIRIANAPGTIDNKWRGETCVIVDNVGDEDYIIHAGDRIAQFVLERVNQFYGKVVDNIDEETERGANGFGSTGV